MGSEKSEWRTTNMDHGLATMTYFSTFSEPSNQRNVQELQVSWFHTLPTMYVTNLLLFALVLTIRL